MPFLVFLLGFCEEFRKDTQLSMFENGLPFQSDAGNISPVMIPMENFCLSSTSTISEAFPWNSDVNSMSASTSGFHSAGNSSVSGLKHEASASVDWSVEEQFLLEKGLEKYRDEPKIMKYIKIAATLPDKTVRDVALRCRWMQRKRRKGEEHSAAKKISNRKDKLMDASPKLNTLSDAPQQNIVYPSFVNNMSRNVHTPYGGLSDNTIDLLRRNAQALSQISYNISARKLQDNINLFSQARNDISAILNDMREMPGIMNRMPPLTVSINDDLARSILMGTTQPINYTVPSSINLKQEPRS